MLDVTVLTLFPEMFTGVMRESMLKRAQQHGLFQFQTVNFRDFASDKHHTVDDYPFGGGAGMLLKPGPLFLALESLGITVDSGCDDMGPAVSKLPSENEHVDQRVILLTPQGRTFTQSIAENLAAAKQLVFICGHYEGVDDRVRQHLVTDELSIGDFVLTGGEIVAMAMIDAVVRLLPGVLGNEDSARDESFSGGLLEYPQYTRPANFRGMEVPNTLLSGHHARIERWRRRHALYRTWKRRPDLLNGIELNIAEKADIDRWIRGDLSDIDVPD